MDLKKVREREGEIEKEIMKIKANSRDPSR